MVPPRVAARHSTPAQIEALAFGAGHLVAGLVESFSSGAWVELQVLTPSLDLVGTQRWPKGHLTALAAGDRAAYVAGFGFQEGSSQPFKVFRVSLADPAAPRVTGELELPENIDEPGLGTRMTVRTASSSRGHPARRPGSGKRLPRTRRGVWPRGRGRCRSPGSALHHRLRSDAGDTGEGNAAAANAAAANPGTGRD